MRALALLVVVLIGARARGEDDISWKFIAAPAPKVVPPAVSVTAPLITTPVPQFAPYAVTSPYGAVTGCIGGNCQIPTRPALFPRLRRP